MSSPISLRHLAFGALLLAAGCSGESVDSDSGEVPSASGGIASGTGGASSGGASSGGHFSGEGLAESAAGGSGGSLATGGQSSSSGGEQASGGGPPVEPPEPKLERVLAYNLVDVNPKTGKLRGHTGVGEDEKLLQSLGKQHGFSVEITDDPSIFTPDKLSQVDVLVFRALTTQGRKSPDKVATRSKHSCAGVEAGSAFTTRSRWN